jgi:hypothetical protein
MTQTVVTLSCAAVVAISYAACAVWRKGACKFEDLFLSAFNSVAAVTGVYIFVGALTGKGLSGQDFVWAGITGVCMSIYWSVKLLDSFRGLFTSGVRPQRASDASSSSQSQSD